MTDPHQIRATTPDEPMSARIRRKLEAAFSPSRLDVIDESEQHRGHGGWREGGETHFRVILRDPALAELSRIERSRQVHAVLAAELDEGVHALALDLGGDEAA